MLYHSPNVLLGLTLYPTYYMSLDGIVYGMFFFKENKQREEKI